MRARYNRDYFHKHRDLDSDKLVVYQHFFSKIVKKKPKISKLLDAGCGEGLLLSIADKSGIETHGIDISDFGISVASSVTRAKLHNLNLENSRLPYGKNSFDVVCAIEVIEHIANVNWFFSESNRVLKTNGLLFLTTPNSNSIFSLIFSRLVPDDPTHINLQSVKFWVDILRSQGFCGIEAESILLFGFPPSVKLRNLFRFFKIPVKVKPIYSPAAMFAATNIISAFKEKS